MGRMTQAGPDADIYLKNDPWLDMCDSLNPGEEQDWDPAPPDVSKFVMLTKAAADAPCVGLRERYIQHMTVSILYWQFLAAWDLVGTVGYSDPMGWGNRAKDAAAGPSAGASGVRAPHTVLVEVVDVVEQAATRL